MGPNYLEPKVTISAGISVRPRGHMVCSPWMKIDTHRNISRAPSLEKGGLPRRRAIKRWIPWLVGPSRERGGFVRKGRWDGLEKHKFVFLAWQSNPNTRDNTNSLSLLAPYVPIRDQPRVELVRGHPDVFLWAEAGLFGNWEFGKFAPHDASGSYALSLSRWPSALAFGSVS
jgi:hypothetical protein